jgi:hypothetical protein
MPRTLKTISFSQNISFERQERGGFVGFEGFEDRQGARQRSVLEPTWTAHLSTRNPFRKPQARPLFGGVCRL